MALVVPAVLPSSRKKLEEELALFTRIPSISRVQIDVVDGRFATPASWPCSTPTELGEMKARGEMLQHFGHFEYEIDLMCLDADAAAEAWLALGATRLVFHAESATDISRLLTSARKRYSADGFASLIPFGLALNLASDLSLIEQCLGQVEFVQFMGIAHIGRQGQPFDRRVLEKVRVFHSRHPEIPIQVDGGISLDNAKELVALGASALVVGSKIVCAGDPSSAVSAFEAL